jgi:transcriptional antiterminator RfaH
MSARRSRARRTCTAKESPLPLKTLQPSLYPESLLESADPPNDQAAWFVFRTRPRAEKVLAERLLSRSLPYFLPLETRRWRKNGRSFTSHLPLFPGYLFFRGDDDQRRDALETNLIASTLTVADQGRLHADLRNVQRVLDTGRPLTPECRLAPGTPVVIRSGSMAGVEGVVLRQGGNLKMIVQVRFLQQGVSLAIEGWMLAPQPGPTARAARQA